MSRLSLKSFLKADSGIAAIEMAFILPFMLFLYFGLIDLTQLISFNRKVTAVAAATADIVGQNRNALLKTDVEDYFKLTGMIMKPTPDSKVKVRIMGYRLVNGTVTKLWTLDNGKGMACANAPATSTLNTLMAAGNDLVLAQSCMKFEPYIGKFLGEKIVSSTNFNIEQIVTVRPRSSLQLNCFLTTAGGTPCPVN